jgi:hypothetical protein
VTLSGRDQLGEVGAELHGPIVAGLGDDSHRPRLLPPVNGQVRQQFHDGAVPDDDRRNGLSTGVPLGRQGTTALGELPQMPVDSDFAGVGVVDHNLTGPIVCDPRASPSVTADRYCPTGSL